MKTIGGLILGWFAGMFVACASIMFVTLFDLGFEQIGFPRAVLSYYLISLGICVAMLVLSNAARKHLKFMMFFVIAVVMVMAIGLGQTGGGGFTAGSDLYHADELISEMIVMLARAAMYVIPGAMAALYTILAYNGVCDESKQDDLTLAD